MIKSLVKLANSLDKNGFKKEADEIDFVIKKISQDKAEPSMKEVFDNACKLFTELTPEPKKQSNLLRSRATLGKENEKVVFFLNGRNDYPLIGESKTTGEHAFSSKEEMLKTLSDAIHQAFNSAGIPEKIKGLKFESVSTYIVPNSFNVKGYKVTTNIPAPSIESDFGQKIRDLYSDINPLM